MTISTQDFRDSMAHFPGAVTLVTVGSGDARRGITATAVCSVSDTPPSLLVCVNRQTDTCAEITRTGRFSVQLLDDTADEIAMTFAGARGLDGAAKFTAGDWDETQGGQPRLSSALVCLCCEVDSHSDSGTHRIFIGRIKESTRANGEALVYAQSRFRRLQAAG
ncbi:MAG: flavin reductase [Maritimibacter sp.]|nr:flavin reductase [Maritimibacter sp.]